MTEKTERGNGQLDALLVELRRRQRTRTALNWLCRGALFGAVAAMIAGVVVVLLWPGSAPAFAWYSAIGVAGISLGAASAGLLRRVDDLAVARALDRSACGEDRFASAMQLVDHHRQSRAQFAVSDALARVSCTTPQSAIPLQTPAALKWVPIPVIALAAIIWLAPGDQLSAQPPAVAEVSDEEWEQVHDEFEKELAELFDRRTEDNEHLVDELQRLAELLKQHPQKRDVLARIAELQADLEKQQQGLGMNQLSMRQASRSIQSSTLSALAAMLQQGNYQGAASELKALADRLQENKQSLTAAQFENVASDFDALAAALSSHSELSEVCQRCADAAASMNRQSLADALKRMSQTLDKNAKKLSTGDSLCRSRDMLNRLNKRLNQCRGGKCSSSSSCSGGQCKGGCSSFVRRSDKKGGLRAGWGTADNWSGGQMRATDDQRIADMVDARDAGGPDDTFSTVSADERARSAQDEKNRYVDLIKKAEADLDLESIPLTYRDYLRRYFVSIRPADTEPSP